jgi:ferritin-like metal-binding protein YciE
MKLETLHDAYIHELKDLLSAERQLIKALPKMAKASTHEDLATGFEEHLRQTEEHVSRLEKILSDLGESTARVEKCKAMEGLIAEGADLIAKGGTPEIVDALLIGAAQRVEHYEIAAYGTARTFAEILGESDAVDVLQTTLGEEGDTDKKLTELAVNTVNANARAAAA